METSGCRNADDLVVVRSNDAGQLRNSCRVAARGETDKKFAAETENVAAFDGTGKFDPKEFAKWGERGGDGCGFAAAGFRAERKNDRQFVQHQGGIFHKHGIGEFGFGGKRNDACTELGKQIFVFVMLSLRDREIDRLARDETKFTISKRGTDRSRDGGKHGEKNLTEERATGKWIAQEEVNE